MAVTKEQQKQIVMAVAAVGLFGYTFFWILMPKVNERITTTSAQLDEVQGKVEQMKQTASRLLVLQRECDELDKEVAKIEKRLPRDRNLQEIIRTVTDLARKYRVTITNFAPQGESGQQYYVEVPYALSVQGSLHSIGRFLSVIGQQERIFSARNLSLSYAPNEKRGYTVTGSFTLVSYVYNG